MTEVMAAHRRCVVFETRPCYRRGRGIFVLRACMAAVALVVDDSMVIRHTICRFLEDRGFAVESASNGVEALEILSRVVPALVITDMQMPAMGGSELITAIKNEPSTARVPIVIVTGRSSGYDSREN